MSATPAADDPPVSLAELAAAVNAIEQCLAQIDADPGSGLGFGRENSTLLLLHLSTAGRRLEALAGVNVVTWPDVRWALHFCNARELALNAIRSADSPRSWRNGGWQTDALRDVRDLIIQRYPQTTQTREGTADGH